MIKLHWVLVAFAAAMSAQQTATPRLTLSPEDSAKSPRLEVKGALAFDPKDFPPNLKAARGNCSIPLREVPIPQDKKFTLRVAPPSGKTAVMPQTRGPAPPCSH